MGVGAPGGGVLGLQNALPARPTGGTTAAEYSRYTGQEGAAAVQAAEGDAENVAASVERFGRASARVDTTLNRSVATALDVALANGVIAPAFTGFEALATASTSAVYTAIPDAVSEGVASMQIAGFAPDAVALNPADWLAAMVATGSDGHYKSGSYLGVLPMQMRGLRVVLSPSVDAGKALLMDTSHSELLIVDDFSDRDRLCRSGLHQKSGNRAGRDPGSSRCFAPSVRRA